jgi:leader peptidase (prepilin peptidase)/N-methyltransferase
MDIWIDITVNVFIFIFGASIGSFINVVAYRLPAQLSILWPPSRCPSCIKKLKSYDNIPILGWLWLKGRCRYCKNKISPRYLVVEVFTGIIFLAVHWVFQTPILVIGYWTFCSWLLALSLIDLDTMILPNSLTKSGLVLGLVFQITLGLALAADKVGVVKHLMVGIAGAVVGLWLFEALSLIGCLIFGKIALGAGDAKLVAMIGAWIGWRYLLIAILIACVSGVLVGGGAIILSRHKMGKRMPFGPFLAFGAVVTIFSGETLLAFYWRLFIPGS